MLDTADSVTACRVLDGFSVPAFLLEAAPDGAWRWVGANVRMAALLDSTVAGLTGLTVAATMAAPQAIRLARCCGDCRRDGGAVLDERGAGSLIAGWRCILIPLDDGRVMGTAARAAPERDHSGQRDHSKEPGDEAARARELERMLDLQAEMISRFTPDGTILFVNQSHAERYRVAKHEMVGTSIYAAIPDEEREMVRLRLLRLADEPGPIIGENRVVLAEGTTIWFEYSNQAICDPGGRVVEIIAVGRDITERKLADERLKESEQRYRQLLDTSPDAVFVEVDHQIVLANQRTADLFGFREPDELLGQDPFSFLPQGSRRLALTRRDRLVGAGGAGAPIEIRLQPRQGPLREIEMSAAPITVDGRPGVVMTMRDVGLRKRQERQLRASEQRFRRLVQSLPEAFWIVQDGRCAFANGAAARLVGLARAEEMTTRSFLDLVEPSDHQRVDRMVLQLALDPTRQEVLELALRHVDGRRVEIEATAMTIQHFDRPAVQLTARDVTARNAEQAVIARLALHDPLTGLPNRIQLRTELERACARARRDSSRVGVLCLDLDGFKAVNDGLGHAAGDAVLVEVARRLRQSLRESDFAARLGGDEFTVIASGIDSSEHVEMLASRLIEAISAPIEIGHEVARVGTSIGTTIFPDDQSPIDALLAHADAALYAAKRAGRRTHRSYATIEPTRAIDPIEPHGGLQAMLHLAAAIDR